MDCFRSHVALLGLPTTCRPRSPSRFSSNTASVGASRRSNGDESDGQRLAALGRLCQAVDMRRDTVIEVIRAHVGDLRALGVGSLSLFGSVARDEARPDSDIDVLVELERPSGLLGLMRIRFFLEDLLSTRVDVVTRGGLDAATTLNVMRDAMHIA